jgi:hypothetical protein
MDRQGLLIVSACMMNGCNRPLVMPRPLIAPASAPAARPISIASGHGAPLSIDEAKAIAENPTIDPTERSIPAVRMTNVIPMPRRPTMAVWRETLTRLSNSKK